MGYQPLVEGILYFGEAARGLVFMGPGGMIPWKEEFAFASCAT